MAELRCRCIVHGVPVTKLSSPACLRLVRALRCLANGWVEDPYTVRPWDPRAREHIATSERVPHLPCCTGDVRYWLRHGRIVAGVADEPTPAWVGRLLCEGDIEAVAAVLGMMDGQGRVCRPGRQ